MGAIYRNSMYRLKILMVINVLKYATLMKARSRKSLLS
jgi:hypothetical protein